MTAGLVRAVAGGIVAGGIGASGVLFADHGVRARWQALVASHGVPSASATLPVGDEAVAMALVRSALVSLNDANRSGNYDVLRALAAPEFAARNPAQALAATFGAFARAGVDLSAVTILPAVLDRPPARDRDGLLQVAGRFEGAALRLAFNLAFKAHSGRWRIHTLGLRTEPVVAPTARVGTVPPASRG